MQIFSLALLSAIASARSATNLLDMGTFPNVMDKMNDHFDGLDDFGSHKDHDDFSIDDLDIGSGLKEWNPFKQTQVDIDNFDTRITKTSKHTRTFSDGTRIITLVKKMGDRETTNVITIMPDGAWRQESITKIVKTSNQQDLDQELDEPSEDFSDDDYDDIIIPSKPKVTDEPSEDDDVDDYDDVDIDDDVDDDDYDDIIIPSKPKVTNELSEDDNVDDYDDVDIDDDVDVDNYDNVIIPSKPKVTTPSICIQKHSVPKCGKCQSHDQCGEGSFCCPYMKKCVQSSNTQCTYPIAGCSGDTCSNKDFPNNWGGKTCEDNDQSSSEKDTDIITPKTEPTITQPIAGKRMMGTKEHDAFNEQNEIRTNPKSIISKVQAELDLFDSTGKVIERPGIHLRTNEGIGAWFEAIDELKNQDTFPPLEWNDYLALAAEDHCNDQGPRGTTGHNGSDGSRPWDRINKYGKWGGTVSENLAYGRSEGDEYMVQLYIDDGVEDRGHRINMLNPELKLTGMAYCEHKSFGGMMAVAYAKSFTPNSHGKTSVTSRAKN